MVSADANSWLESKQKNKKIVNFFIVKPQMLIKLKQPNTNI